MSDVAVVIPCFNEAKRLNTSFFLKLIEQIDCTLIFIDDGSTDGTDEILRSKFSDLSIDAQIITFLSNTGKATAISKGLEVALKLNKKFLVFCDADSSISIEDIEKLYRHIKQNDNCDLVSGARVPLSGSDVVRKDFRKWIGRIVATLVSEMTHIAVYDPMSPLKIYRLERFHGIENFKPRTRWLGEVELMFFVFKANKDLFTIDELAINFWRDKEGGHIGLRSSMVLTRDFIELRKVIRSLGRKSSRIYKSKTPNK